MQRVLNNLWRTRPSSLRMLWLLPHPLPGTWTGDTGRQETTCSQEGGGRRWSRSQIVRRREPWSSVNTLILSACSWYEQWKEAWSYCAVQLMHVCVCSHCGSGITVYISVLWNRTVTIFYGSGSGSDFWKVMVPVLVPTFKKVMVPVPVPAPYLDHKKQI